MLDFNISIDTIVLQNDPKKKPQYWSSLLDFGLKVLLGLVCPKPLG